MSITAPRAWICWYIASFSFNIFNKLPKSLDVVEASRPYILYEVDVLRLYSLDEMLAGTIQKLYDPLFRIHISPLIIVLTVLVVLNSITQVFVVCLGVVQFLLLEDVELWRAPLWA
ncbi:hypothetical protein C1646_775151 [Rhizophagus diaphanus]|nr:hypothetical protein C1646_775151 [Rhizophagus diaphanus] [Rhizophagus sp. MUCL 43196]